LPHRLCVIIRQQVAHEGAQHSPAQLCLRPGDGGGIEAGGGMEVDRARGAVRTETGPGTGPPAGKGQGAHDVRRRGGGTLAARTPPNVPKTGASGRRDVQNVGAASSVACWGTANTALASGTELSALDAAVGALAAGGAAARSTDWPNGASASPVASRRTATKT
jgi:hypothetical protein